MSFERMIHDLVEAEVRFVVIGGFAATTHGSARFTNDLDICYDTATDNLERLAALLASWHAYLRGADRGLPFFMDVRTFRTTPLMALTTDLGDIDVLDYVAGVGDYRATADVSERMMMGATPFYALSLTALVQAKRAAGRRKDIEHLIELEAMLAIQQETAQTRDI